MLYYNSLERPLPNYLPFMRLLILLQDDAIRTAN